MSGQCLPQLRLREHDQHLVVESPVRDLETAMQIKVRHKLQRVLCNVRIATYAALRTNGTMHLQQPQPEQLAVLRFDEVCHDRLSLRSPMPCHASHAAESLSVPASAPSLPRTACRTFRNASLRLDTHSDSFCTGTCRSSRKPRQSEAKLVRAMLQPVARCCNTRSLQKLRRRDLPCRAERVRAIAARHRPQADGRQYAAYPVSQVQHHWYSEYSHRATSVRRWRQYAAYPVLLLSTAPTCGR